MCLSRSVAEEQFNSLICPSDSGCPISQTSNHVEIPSFQPRMVLSRLVIVLIKLQQPLATTDPPAPGLSSVITTLQVKLQQCRLPLETFKVVSEGN